MQVAEPFTSDRFATFVKGRVTILRKRGVVTGILEGVERDGDWLYVYLMYPQFSPRLGEPVGNPTDEVACLVYEISFALEEAWQPGAMKIHLVEDGFNTTLHFFHPEEDSVKAAPARRLAAV